VLAILKLLINLIVFSLITTPVYAINTPTLVSPTDKSTVSSNTLTWEVVPEASQYRVIVDDEESISSPYIKNYYSIKNQYSPKLDNKTYYWKVAAKDGSGIWSEFSPIWSFALNSSIISEDSSADQDKKAATIFETSNVPSEIKSDQSFKLSVKLETEKPNTKYFLKGAFKKSEGSNYFGETKVGSGWVKNGSSYSSQLPITADPSGKWSGELEVRPDSEDSGFDGSGEYLFKVARYSETASGLTWSNETKIKITLVEVSPSLSPLPSPSSKPTIKPSPSEVIAEVIEEASVAGTETTIPETSSIPLIASTAQNNPSNIFVILGLILIGISAGIGVYFYINSRRQIKI